MTLYRDDGSEILSGDVIIVMQEMAFEQSNIARLRYGDMLRKQALYPKCDGYCREDIYQKNLDKTIIAQEYSAIAYRKIRKELGIE